MTFDPEAILAFAARGLDIQRAKARQVVSLNTVVRHDLSRGAKLLAEAFRIRRHVVTSAAEFSLGYKTDWVAAAIDQVTLTESATAQWTPGSSRGI